MRTFHGIVLAAKAHITSLQAIGLAKDDSITKRNMRRHVERTMQLIK